jgi:hypothetical protein
MQKAATRKEMPLREGPHPSPVAKKDVPEIYILAPDELSSICLEIASIL